MLELRVWFRGLTGCYQIADHNGGEAGDSVGPLKGRWVASRLADTDGVNSSAGFRDFPG